MPPRLRSPARPTLTTGDVARVFDVSLRMVVTWADSGLLACHRLPGPAGRPGDRRFLAGDVVAFARRHGLPCPIDTRPVVAATADARLLAALHAAGLDVRVAACPAEAGWLLGQVRPAAVLLDRGVLSADDVHRTAGLVARLLPGVRAVALLAEDDDPAAAPGGARALARPCDPAAVAAALQED